MDLGVQLYIFSRRLKQGDTLAGFLSPMAEAGYAGIETPPGSRDLTGEDLRKAGLKACGLHAVTCQGELDPENLDTLIAYLKSIDCQDVCASGLLEWNERSAEDYRTSAEHLNAAGRTLREEGIFLHYHNHDFEFDTLVEGAHNGMELLLDAFDPDAVSLCLDLGWVWTTGVDTQAWLREHASWVRYVHLRDWQEQPDGGNAACALGEGEMPQEGIFAALSLLPQLRHVVVEHDPIDDADEAIRRMRSSRAFAGERLPAN
ncbi:MAG: sugar phosphate isomerase/epimerase family protein [Opitutales bacterium]